MGYRSRGLLVSSILLLECSYVDADESNSGNGDAWSSFTYDMARSRTYRWGEDGIAGVSDTHGRMNIAFAFWNEKE